MAKFKVQTSANSIHEVEAFDYYELNSLVIFTDHQKNKVFSLPVGHVKTIRTITE